MSLSSEAPRQSRWRPGTSSTSQLRGLSPQEEEEPSADQLQAPFHRTVVGQRAVRRSGGVEPVWAQGYQSEQISHVDSHERRLVFLQGFARARVFPAAALAVGNVRGGCHRVGPRLDGGTGAAREDDQEVDPPWAVSLAPGDRCRSLGQCSTHRARQEKLLGEEMRRRGCALQLLRADAVVRILQAHRCGHHVLGRAGSPSSSGGGRRWVPGAHRWRRTCKWPRRICRAVSWCSSLRWRGLGRTHDCCAWHHAAAGGGGAGALALAGWATDEGRHGWLGRGLSRQGHGQERQQHGWQVVPALENVRWQGGQLQLEPQTGQVCRRGPGQAVFVGQGACLSEVPQRQEPFSGSPAVGLGAAPPPLAGMLGDGATSHLCPNAEKVNIAVESHVRGSLPVREERPSPPKVCLGPATEEAAEGAISWEKFRGLHLFRFVHWLAGTTRFGVNEAVIAEAAKYELQAEHISLDRGRYGVDLAADEPAESHLAWCSPRSRRPFWEVLVQSSARAVHRQEDVCGGREIPPPPPPPALSEAYAELMVKVGKRRCRRNGSSSYRGASRRKVAPLVRVGRLGNALVWQQLAKLSWRGSRAGRFGLSVPSSKKACGAPARQRQPRSSPLSSCTQKRWRWRTTSARRTSRARRRSWF